MRCKAASLLLIFLLSLLPVRDGIRAGRAGDYYLGNKWSEFATDRGSASGYSAHTLKINPAQIAFLVTQT